MTTQHSFTIDTYDIIANKHLTGTSTYEEIKVAIFEYLRDIAHLPDCSKYIRCCF